jgi:hypothetical protein
MKNKKQSKPYSQKVVQQNEIQTMQQQKPRRTQICNKDVPKEEAANPETMHTFLQQ